MRVRVGRPFQIRYIELIRIPGVEGEDGGDVVVVGAVFVCIFVGTLMLSAALGAEPRTGTGARTDEGDDICRGAE